MGPKRSYGMKYEKFKRVVVRPIQTKSLSKVREHPEVKKFLSTIERKFLMNV